MPHSDTYGAAIFGTTGLVGYWRLGEPSGTNAADELGLHNGTYTNTAGITYGQTGLLGAGGTTAVLLNGTSGYVDLGTAVGNFTGTSSFSTECWVKITGNPAALATCVSRNNDGATDPGWAARITTGGNLYTERGNSAAGPDNAPPVAPGALSLGGWHHFVYTYNGVNMQVYLDGSTYGAVQPSSRSITTQVVTATIGFDQQAGGFFFPGYIGEVALYSAALSPATISSHYTTGITPIGLPGFPAFQLTNAFVMDMARRS